jgi:hypothetical protein
MPAWDGKNDKLFYSVVPNHKAGERGMKKLALIITSIIHLSCSSRI